MPLEEKENTLMTFRSKIDIGKAPAAAGEAPAVDPAIWKALAFSSPKLPSAGSAVYYFSNGHAEQCSSRPDRPPQHLFPSFALQCHLAAVNLHADPTTEQVFATFSLTADFSSPTKTAKTFSAGEFISVVKTLSKTETNRNSKRFLMLPERAHEVFCCSGDDVEVYDVTNRRWRFRHVVTGNPPLHLLTAGWGHFVSCKLLVAGDEVVFARDADGLIFVGCRRCDDHECDVNAMNTASSSSSITRIRKKREEIEMAIEIMRWAVKDGEGMVEGRYYPDSKLPAYVVEKEVVESSMRVPWERGMRVRKEREMPDGYTCWLNGTVRAVPLHSSRNPWRMLEVFWDKTFKRTWENPWDVEPIPARTKTKLEEEIQIID